MQSNRPSLWCISPGVYSLLRGCLGTQEHVARCLGVSRATIIRRESNVEDWVGAEASIAIVALVRARPEALSQAEALGLFAPGCVSLLVSE